MQLTVSSLSLSNVQTDDSDSDSEEEDRVRLPYLDALLAMESQYLSPLKTIPSGEGSTTTTSEDDSDNVDDDQEDANLLRFAEVNTPSDDKDDVSEYDAPSKPVVVASTKAKTPKKSLISRAVSFILKTTAVAVVVAVVVPAATLIVSVSSDGPLEEGADKFLSFMLEYTVVQQLPSFIDGVFAYLKEMSQSYQLMTSILVSRS